VHIPLLHRSALQSAIIEGVAPFRGSRYRFEGIISVRMQMLLGLALGTADINRKLPVKYRRIRKYVCKKKKEKKKKGKKRKAIMTIKKRGIKIKRVPPPASVISLTARACPIVR